MSVSPATLLLWASSNRAHPGDAAVALAKLVKDNARYPLDIADVAEAVQWALDCAADEWAVAQGECPKCAERAVQDAIRDLAVKLSARAEWGEFESMGRETREAWIRVARLAYERGAR